MFHLQNEGWIVLFTFIYTYSHWVGWWVSVYSQTACFLLCLPCSLPWSLFVSGWRPSHWVISTTHQTRARCGNLCLCGQLYSCIHVGLGGIFKALASWRGNSPSLLTPMHILSSRLKDTFAALASVVRGKACWLVLCPPCSYFVIGWYMWGALTITKQNNAKQNTQAWMIKGLNQVMLPWGGSGLCLEKVSSLFLLYT
jgi:hypothetical protein